MMDGSKKIEELKNLSINKLKEKIVSIKKELPRE